MEIASYIRIPLNIVGIFIEAMDRQNAHFFGEIYVYSYNILDII